MREGERKVTPQRPGNGSAFAATIAFRQSCEPLGD
jgi:hypothetical protein